MCRLYKQDLYRLYSVYIYIIIYTINAYNNPSVDKTKANDILLASSDIRDNDFSKQMKDSMKIEILYRLFIPGKS